VLERSAYLSVILLIATILAFSTAASAGDVNPLRPVDTSSPRATLEDFVVTMDGAYRGMKVNMQQYAASRRLYPTADERRRRAEIFSAAAKATKVLELSDIPPVQRETVAAERAIQLKEYSTGSKFLRSRAFPTKTQQRVCRPSDGGCLALKSSSPLSRTARVPASISFLLRPSTASPNFTNASKTCHTSPARVPN